MFGIVAATLHAETCRTSDVPSISAQVRQAEELGEVLGTFQTRAGCFSAWGERLRNGQTDEGKHLACVTRQGVLGDYQTDLRALDLQAADGLCLRINACLFDLFDLSDLDPAKRALGRDWDRLSCDGE